MILFPLPSRALLALSTVSLLGLAGCEDFEGFSALGEAPASDTQSIDIIERDIEKPEIFSQRDMALWDGRPSFGGVWVALPGNIQPERVSITNVDNGQSVVGALFKREEQNPGPPIRLSSDAAAALNVVPGQPTLVAVTVVRRETFANVPNTPADAVPAEVETASIGPADAPEAEVSELAEQLETALTDATEEAPQPAETATAAATVAATAAASEAPRQRRSLLDFFRNRRGSSEAEAPEGVISVVTPEDTANTQITTGAAPLAIETSTLGEQAVEPEPRALPEPAPRSEPAAAPSSGLASPYLQTGTFSTRENAQKQVTALDSEGVPALIRTQSSDSGRTLYRVIAGPAISSAQQRSFLATINGLGIRDAFPTPR